MDNMIFDIRGDKHNFHEAMEYVKTIAPGNKATHYAIAPGFGLVLFWSHPGTDKLWWMAGDEGHTEHKEIKIEVKTFDIPFEKFVEHWVFNQDPKDYNPGKWEQSLEEDCDASVGEGFKMWCEGWGHVGNNHYAFAVVKPIAAWYGK